MESRKTETEIRIEGSAQGRVFEGIGGITSNGMSKLLMDYPAQQQQEIMELLFRPGYGASLQHLKVEIGSDVNTSSGTEPSHMRSSDDGDITRGYGLPILRRAKDIHPELPLDALRWGTPLWIKNDEDKLRFYLSFLQGAKDVYGLEFDYLGPDINEGAFSRDWAVRTLKPGLERAGFGSIRLVADDSDHGWDIADHAACDAGLFEAVHAYCIHYSQESTATARDSGKPLWLSEDLAPFRHSFSKGALHIGKRIVDMYATGRMVKYELHPLVEAEYENTPFNYKGILVATWPWSGHYRIDPGLWVIAHFTQFMQPGWVYQDDACATAEWGGYVVLKDPGTGDTSIVIVNNSPEVRDFSLRLDLEFMEAAGRRAAVWRTTEHEHFCRLGELAAADGLYRLTVSPYAIYTVTTTTGQRKGSEGLVIPPETCFPLPYRDALGSGRLGANPRYTSDQGGAFELDRQEAGREELCLRQQLTEDRIPIDWTYRNTPEPYTLIGSLEWANYRVSVELRLEADRGYAGLGGRVNYTAKSNEPPEGYWLRMRHNGQYVLHKGKLPLAEGRVKQAVPWQWHQLALAFHGNTIRVEWDGETLLTVTDSEIPSGQAVLLSGYHPTAYRNLAIEPIALEVCTDCSRYDDIHADLRYEGSWTRADGDYNVYARTLTQSEEAGAALHFSFRGTGVSILGKKAEDGGIAHVYVDGEYMGTVDTYQRIAGFRKSLFSLYGLAAGETHEVRLLVTGLKHPDSLGGRVCIDAVEVVGGTLFRQDRP
ncbi:MAG: Galactosylceramidase [Paenibacillaceae bacterium]|jgi:galactosylceramidase|nr:Galactosylceramidase [Paenibacillaceae bacterium]